MDTQFTEKLRTKPVLAVVQEDVNTRTHHCVGRRNCHYVSVQLTVGGPQV